jgi:short-subunit dehydrogenase
MKVCVLIGYGPGIGAAAARRWSQGGFAVALVSRTKEKLDAAAKEIPNSKVSHSSHSFCIYAEIFAYSPPEDHNNFHFL